MQKFDSPRNYEYSKCFKRSEDEAIQSPRIERSKIVAQRGVSMEGNEGVARKGV